MSAGLSLEEYEQRAIPRLAVIDELTPRCQWEKFDHQCDDITLTMRGKLVLIALDAAPPLPVPPRLSAQLQAVV